MKETKTHRFLLWFKSFGWHLTWLWDEAHCFMRTCYNHVISNHIRHQGGIHGAERDWLKRLSSIPILAESRPRAESASNPVSPASCFSFSSGCRNLLAVWWLPGCEFDGVPLGTVIAGDPVKRFTAGRGGRPLSPSPGFGIMKTYFPDVFMFEAPISAAT